MKATSLFLSALAVSAGSLTAAPNLPVTTEVKVQTVLPGTWERSSAVQIEGENYFLLQYVAVAETTGLATVTKAEFAQPGVVIATPQKFAAAADIKAFLDEKGYGYDSTANTGPITITLTNKTLMATEAAITVLLHQPDLFLAADYQEIPVVPTSGSGQVNADVAAGIEVPALSPFWRYTAMNNGEVFTWMGWIYDYTMPDIHSESAGKWFSVTKWVEKDSTQNKAGIDFWEGDTAGNYFTSRKDWPNVWNWSLNDGKGDWTTASELWPTGK